MLLKMVSIRKNALASGGSAPEPAGGAYSAPPYPLAAALIWLLTIEEERLGALIHCPAPGR